ncbi:MAG: IPTL-CTERM sorting domain-containing protein [Deltaproteobacteria bacterium]|nr:IPTL-CTERM sorting domain-containing protein [Deltaproteobacteria bacterium]
MKKIMSLLVFGIVFLWCACSLAQVRVAPEGLITGKVFYAGGDTKPIHIGAFKLPCHQNTGAPTDGTTIIGPGNYSIGPLLEGSYHVCAFMDMDESGPVPDPEDPQGESPGNPISVEEEQTTSFIDIVLYDPGPIPTLSQWGALALALILGGVAFFAVRRRRRAL